MKLRNKRTIIQNSVDNLVECLDRIIESSDADRKQEESAEYLRRRCLFITDEDYQKESKFAQYRHSRAHKKSALGEFTYEDVYDFITQEELDWDLEHKLGRGFKTPEQRYQDRRKYRWNHKSNWFFRNNGKGGYDGYGCEGKTCISECRFYPEEGRIEDSEIIQEHQKYVDKLKQENRIVEPPTLPLQHIPGHPSNCSKCQSNV